MENKQGYDPSEFEDDDYTTPQPDAGKSIRGYRIVIIILSVILVRFRCSTSASTASRCSTTSCCRPTATRSRTTWGG